MKIELFLNKIKKEWLVKLICLVLACFTYFFYQMSTLDTKTIVIPLEISSNGEMLPVEYHQSQVKVSFKGKQDDLANISSKDISASLNIDYYSKSGKYDIPVQLNLSPNLLVMEPLEVNVIPSIVSLEIDSRAYAQIPVQPSIQGEPLEGYNVEEIKVVPSTVGITGAELLISSVPYLTTETINVEGKKDSFTLKTSVIKNNNMISFTDETSVSVEVSIEPIQVTRSFNGHALYLNGLNPAFEAKIIPETIDFSLAGSNITLNKYIPELYTARVDCSSIEAIGEYTLAVLFSIPQGTRLVSQSVSAVNLIISEVTDDILTEDTQEDNLQLPFAQE